MPCMNTNTCPQLTKWPLPPPPSFIGQLANTERFQIMRQGQIVGNPAQTRGGNETYYLPTQSGDLDHFSCTDELSFDMPNFDLGILERILVC